MFHIYERTFYVLDQQTALAFDAQRPPEHQCFATLLPESNAYLLDEAAVDPLQDDDCDLGERERGCFLALDEQMSQTNRRFLFSGFIAQGYALSAYPDHLLLVPWHRSIMDMVQRDLEELCSDLPEQ